MVRRASGIDEARSFELYDPFYDYDDPRHGVLGDRTSSLWLVAQLTVVPLLLMQFVLARWDATRSFGHRPDGQVRRGVRDECTSVTGPSRVSLRRAA